MPLFQCQNCGCRENTACASGGFKSMADSFNWDYAPERKGMRLCCVCGPVFYANLKPTGFGKWHNHFKRIFLPKGEFHTTKSFDFEHIETGLSVGEFMEQFPDRVSIESLNQDSK